MFETIIIATTALIASGLTLFSGFGLGTLLMPVVALFFPIEVAVGMTAVVHLANNIFKVVLLGPRADGGTLIRFGVPAVFFAFAGALLLAGLSSMPPVLVYDIAGKTCAVTPIKLIVGAVIIGFSALEFFPAFADFTFDRKFMPLGGCISGFFGGLSGHQGAFRSMFLIKAGLSKEQFIATGAVVAVMVDLSRIGIYGWDTVTCHKNVDWQLVCVAALSAFAGAFIGARLIKKVTIRLIQVMVSVLLVIVAVGLMAGVL